MNHHTNPDITRLISVMQHFHPLNEGIISYMQEHVTEVRVRKGTLLLQAGAVCEHIYFIKEGSIRGFMSDGERDITTWMSAEDALVTSIYSLDTFEPALDNIQTIEDCRLLSMTSSDLQNLYLLHPEYNIVARKLIQEYYRDAESRAYIVRLSSAEEKYIHFLNRYDHLANKVPLKYIASFLGITLETLSRVRGRISVKGKKASA